jgi:ABC-type nitrate/sulfonate/bicarbonate transport system substrate-binding protein
MFVLVSLVSSTTAAQVKVSIVYSSGAPSETPLWIAHEQGLFAKQGIDAQLIHHEGLGAISRIGAEIPFGVVGVPVAMLAMARDGKDVRILAPVSDPRAVQHVVARPDIKSPADLRDKRFGVSGMGGAFWIMAIRALEHFGLDPERDRVSIVNIGNLPARPGAGQYERTARALETAAADVVILDAAHSAELQIKGFSLLLDMSKSDIAGIQSALVVDGAYLRDRPDDVARVMVGLMEGIAFSLAPGNKDVVQKTQAAHLKLSDAKAIDSGYRTFLTSVARKPYVSVDEVRKLQRIMSLYEPKVSSLRLPDLIDDRFARKLDQDGEIERIFSKYGVR